MCGSVVVNSSLDFQSACWWCGAWLVVQQVGGERKETLLPSVSLNPKSQVNKRPGTSEL